jgi:DNA polymerase-3 subunit delta
MIFFLYGEDTFRSRQKLKAIKEKFKTSDKSGVNLIVLDGEKTPLKNICQEILTVPFLHEKKLIVIENLLKKKAGGLEEIVKLIEKDKIPKSSIIIFWEENDVLQNTKIFNLLNRPKFAERFPLLSETQLTKWTESEIKKRKIKIEAPALKLLTGYVGSDLWQMANEIDKLTAFAKTKKEKQNIITVKDIDLFVKSKLDENIFNLTDALGNKNKKLALKLIGEQIQSGLYAPNILGMLLRQFRILLQIKELLRNEYSFISPADPAIRQKIAKELGLHPYVVSKALYQSKNFEIEELKKIHEKLLSVDIKLKTTNLDPQLLLDLLITQICS